MSISYPIFINGRIIRDIANIIAAEAIVKGDDKIPAISAASIFAKIVSDIR